jgi:hypothetical protein
MPTTCLVNHHTNLIPLDGTFYFVLGPDDRFAFGTMNVTCHAVEGVAGLTPRYLEVIQMATRRQARTGGYDALLDVVVRNNGHVGTGASLVSEWVSYTSVITP